MTFFWILAENALLFIQSCAQNQHEQNTKQMFSLSISFFTYIWQHIQHNVIYDGCSYCCFNEEVKAILQEDLISYLDSLSSYTCIWIY